MTTIGNESRPAYVYDADTDTWVPIGFGPHTHDEYIDKTIITTKGDIIVGTATEAVERLGVGAEGSVLIADPTSPTGLAWGEAGGSITVSTTAPEEPGEGDLWFNSTNATTYIYYDGFWVEQSPAIAGPKGEPGVVASASEPSDTDVLWLDTDEEPDVPVPAGGTTGQVLAKASNTDYATQWVAPSGLEFIKAQTIGTAVNSIVVSDAFSATYDNYRVIISGGTASGTISLSIQIGAATAGYYGGSIRVTQAGVSSAEGQSNQASYEIGRFAAASNQPSMTIDILAPFLTTRTSFFATSVFGDTSSAGGARWNNGYLNNTTSYTSFTLSYSGTITGGTVYVYGYRKA